MDLVSSLVELLDQVQNVLEARFAWMEVQTNNHDQNLIRLTHGQVSQPFPLYLEEIDKRIRLGAVDCDL